MTDNIRKKKALVVEDEPIITRICQRILTAEGYEVDIAMNGLIAIQMVNGKKYDLFLSDIKIPQMGGIEFYSYLKKEYPDMAEKIIFSSGDIMSGNTAEFLKESNRPFLPKPFTPDQLRLIVHETFDTKSNNPPGVQGALIPHENQ